MRPIILHIPHSSIEIPDYSNFCISEIDVNKEALYLTDLYTDELFQGDVCDIKLKAECCRIYCDVERFENDQFEPMAKFGMGATYINCDDGRILRNISKKQRNQIMEKYYYPHHKKLTNAVDLQRIYYQEAKIIDCHSFPDTPLKSSYYKGVEKFDFNIGTDKFHTPTKWIDASIDFFNGKGYKLGIDEPYSGSMVPMKHFNRSSEVHSIMLEINRSIYMNPDYSKNEDFLKIKDLVSSFIELIREL